MYFAMYIMIFAIAVKQWHQGFLGYWLIFIKKFLEMTAGLGINFVRQSEKSLLGFNFASYHDLIS